MVFRYEKMMVYHCLLQIEFCIIPATGSCSFKQIQVGSSRPGPVLGEPQGTAPWELPRFHKEQVLGAEHGAMLRSEFPALGRVSIQVPVKS